MEYPAVNETLNVSWLVISSAITNEFKLFQGVMSEYYSICCFVQAEFSVFFSGIFVCSQSGNHPYAHLVKSGYKPEVKYKSSIILLYFCLHIENQTYESDDFNLFFPSLVETDNLKNHFFLKFEFCFSATFPQ